MSTARNISTKGGVRGALGVVAALVLTFASVGPAVAGHDHGPSELGTRHDVPAVGQSASLYLSIETTASGAAVDRDGLGLSAGNVAVIITGDVAVTTVGNDGSYTSRATIASLDVVAAPVAADRNGLVLDNLVGVGVDEWFDPAGVLVAVELVDADELTEPQRRGARTFLAALAAVNVAGPGHTDYVGAAWTSPGRAGHGSLAVDVTYQCRLTSIDDTSYGVELSWAQSVTTEAAAGTFTGTTSGSGSFVRSSDNPLVVEATMYETIDGMLTGPDGNPAPIRTDRVIRLLTAEQ